MRRIRALGPGMNPRPLPASLLLVADRQRAGLVEVLLVKLVPIVHRLHVVHDPGQDLILRLPAGNEVAAGVDLEVPGLLSLGALDNLSHLHSFPPADHSSTGRTSQQQRSQDEPGMRYYLFVVTSSARSYERMPSVCRRRTRGTLRRSAGEDQQVDQAAL